MDSFILFVKKINKISGILSFLLIPLLFIYLGFDWFENKEYLFHITIRIISCLALISVLVRYFEHNFKWNIWIIIYDLLFITYYSFILIDFFNGDHIFIYFFILVFFIRESAALNLNYSIIGLNPGQLFILSFILIIFIGSLLLKLPNATVGDISFIDAFFTSTSAVCVTGLSVVDTGGGFTLFGQIIILFLIQIGGLGIMTFASYFSFFFKGSSSYENRLLFGSMSNQNELNNVFQSLKTVLALTLFIEIGGIIAIFFSYNAESFASFNDHLYFSIFHGISAFNNAGFSLYSNSLNDSTVVFNYPLQIIISLLIVFGGLGFPIMQNVVKLFVYQIRLVFSKLFSKNKPQYRAWIINMNTKIILVTTGSLILFGTIFFAIFEWHGVLQEHGPIGKIIISFSGAITPRTAGFNSFEMQQLALPTILIIMFLMWIGASPASTGGGIKTSTFFIGLLTVFSLSKSQERIEFNKREVSILTIKRAFVIILLSVFVIGLFGFMLIVLEPNHSPLKLLFECVSAFSTVGLSLGLTASLGSGAKVLLILMMFIGRVSTLTILIALFQQDAQKSYSYPKEEVLIN